MPVATIKEFIRHESSSGIVLFFTALAAMIIANTDLAYWYNSVRNVPIAIQVGTFILAKPLLLWVNDGLMAVFFFLVGLEVKRELLEGELSSPAQIALPALGAVGGMVVPALFYVYFNLGDAAAIGGWAIPAATDIAFALGVLSLLGARAPLSLKMFLLALAIFDDIGAIVIIAAFYTADLSANMLAWAGLGFVALIGFNVRGVRSVAPYILVGIYIWVCVLQSGVHATLAGVLVALTIPLRGGRAGEEPPLSHLEHALHPWVAFMVLPAFAFVNAGVDLHGMSFSTLLEPVPLGVLAGLFFGKQIGIFGTVWLADRIGLARKSDDLRWSHLYGASLLAGIGFTMSLFIGTLAFKDGGLYDLVRVGVLAGSLLAGVAGYICLKISLSEDLLSDDDPV